RWAFFIGTDLRRANLFRADLRWAYLIEADLSEADLSESNLIEANLRKTDLEQVNFRDASVAWSYFGDIDLSKAKGLHTVKHFGPSTIGIDSVHRSNGRISEAFLRGAGVPQKFIEYMASLNIEAFAYYSSFISNSNKDQDFAEKLHYDLQKNGIHCWYIPEEMKIGDKVQHNIEQSMRIHEKQVLILSINSLASQWIEKEIENAFEVELKMKKTALIPIRIDTAVLDSDHAWAIDIRKSRDVIDFSDWKDPASFSNALDRLLCALKADN
ncbi:MAG: toll/interleukin-1 receptor domain-containing protein, partial [Desulfobacterales bacterium]